MKMEDWIIKLDGFLQFNEYQILKDAEQVSHEVALRLAEKKYEKFRAKQDKTFESCSFRSKTGLVMQRFES